MTTVLKIAAAPLLAFGIAVIWILYVHTIQIDNGCLKIQRDGVDLFAYPCEKTPDIHQKEIVCTTIDGLLVSDHPICKD